MVISSAPGQNDSGMFEFNFGAARYYHFKGSGVISRWRFNLSTEQSVRQFDYSTISDLVLRLTYTARDGGQEASDALV
jgi:hypothetical protein